MEPLSSQERYRPTPPDQRLWHDVSRLRREKPAEVRLQLQRRAPVNLRQHFRRAAIRFVALVAADLASFYVMRALVRAVRDGAVLGDWVAGQVHGVHLARDPVDRKSTRLNSSH